MDDRILEWQCQVKTLFTFVCKMFLLPNVQQSWEAHSVPGLSEYLPNMEPWDLGNYMGDKRRGFWCLCKARIWR